MFLRHTCVLTALKYTCRKYALRINDTRIFCDVRIKVLFPYDMGVRLSDLYSADTCRLVTCVWEPAEMETAVAVPLIPAGSSLDAIDGFLPRGTPAGDH